MASRGRSVQDKVPESVGSAGVTRSASTWNVNECCYLCGQALDEYNADHVPPRRIFPTAMRPGLKGGLLTLRTHPACQKAYQRDEEYFFNTLLPGALQSGVGPHLAEDFKGLIGRDRPSAKLSETVRRQFEDRPSGLVLPNGLLVQRVEGSRLTRVVWKITRGLFAHHKGLFLPESTPRFIRNHGPFDGEPPDYMRPLMARVGRGHTRECFAYEFADSTEITGWTDAKLNFWLLNFWETHLFFVAFHDPGCQCPKCGPDRSAAD